MRLTENPYLWAEMKSHLAGQQVPSRDSELYDAVAKALEQLTGQSMESREHFFVERFAHGGMSSGYVEPEFWRTRAQKFLLKIRSET